MPPRLVAPVVDLGDPDRTTHAEAPVVLVVGRNTGSRAVVLVVEKSLRIEEAVAVDLEKISVVAVRSRGHLVGQRALSQSILR